MFSLPIASLFLLVQLIEGLYQLYQKMIREVEEMRDLVREYRGLKTEEEIDEWLKADRRVVDSGYRGGAR